MDKNSLFYLIPFFGPYMRRKNIEWFRDRLNEEMDHDLIILSKVQIGVYVTLSDNERELIDASLDSENLAEKREKYRSNKLNHLWEWIPKGHERNVLRAKQKRIEKLLETMDYSKPF